VTLPDHFDTLSELERLAVDETADPAYREAARAALREITESRRQEPIVSAARVLAGYWQNPKFVYDAACAYWEQYKAGDEAGYKRRAAAMVALDALVRRVAEADQEIAGIPATATK
jgi:hypothetical protein